MKSTFNETLKAAIRETINGIKSEGLKFTGIYINEEHDWTEIALMYEIDGVENGDLWEVRDNHLEIVEYGAFDTSSISEWGGYEYIGEEI